MVRSNDFEWKSPTNATIKEYLKKWGKKVPYAEREKSLDKLYKSFPKNDNLYDVLVKVTVLNDFYSTTLFGLVMSIGSIFMCPKCGSLRLKSKKFCQKCGYQFKN